jgi:hypothetical protein
VHQEQAQVGVHDELELRLDRSMPRQALLDGTDDLVVPVADHPHAQLALAAEVREDRGLTDTQALRDLGGGRAFVAAFGEHLAARAHDVAYALFGLRAGRLAPQHAARRQSGQAWCGQGARARTGQPAGFTGGDADMFGILKTLEPQSPSC